MDLVKELRKNWFECTPDYPPYRECRCSLTERAADEIERLRGENQEFESKVSWLEDQKQELWRRLDTRARSEQTLKEEIERLQDERPAYPGAWVATIEELEGENKRLRQELGARKKDNAVEVEWLQGVIRSLRADQSLQQDRISELVDQNNSQFDEIVEAVAEFRGISGWAALVADRLDK